MNIFNKIVVVLILLCLIGLSILAVFNEFAQKFSWSEVSMQLFNPQRDIPIYITVLAFIAIVIISLLLLILEFRKKREKIAKIYNVKSGKALITVDTISQQISDSVLSIDGLKNLKVNIIPKSGGVLINMFVSLEQNLNIPEKITEIIQTAQKVSTEKLNIKVLDTKVTVTNLIPDESNNVYKKVKENEVVGIVQRENKDVGTESKDI